MARQFCWTDVSTPVVETTALGRGRNTKVIRFYKSGLSPKSELRAWTQVDRQLGSALLVDQHFPEVAGTSRLPVTIVEGETARSRARQIAPFPSIKG